MTVPATAGGTGTGTGTDTAASARFAESDDDMHDGAGRGEANADDAELAQPCQDAAATVRIDSDLSMAIEAAAPAIPLAEPCASGEPVVCLQVVQPDLRWSQLLSSAAVNIWTTLSGSSAPQSVTELLKKDATTESDEVAPESVDRSQRTVGRLHVYIESAQNVSV